MKKFYLKPESRFVDINLNNSVLENPNEEPISGTAAANDSVNPWNGYDDIPAANKTVWGKDEEEGVEE